MTSLKEEVNTALVTRIKDFLKNLHSHRINLSESSTSSIIYQHLLNIVENAKQLGSLIDITE